MEKLEKAYGIVQEFVREKYGEGEFALTLLNGARLMRLALENGKV